MQFRKLFNGITIEKLKGRKNLDIEGISSDSREIRKNYLFVACRGNSKDGHNFILDAIRKGASAVVVEKDLDFQINGTTYVKVPDTMEAVAKLADNFYERPTCNMEVVGITGTNGKTTTSYLIRDILESHTKKTGLIGTVNYAWGSRLIPSSFTTPPPMSLYSFISKMKSEDVTALVMEVSSHSLAQKRVKAIQFDSCIFTNISRDHLDYHSTFLDYVASKKRLIDLLASSMKKDKFAVLNGDDENLRKFPSPPTRYLFYGLNSNNEVRAMDIKCNWQGIKFNLISPWYEGRVEVPLVGFFNVYNVLAAISWAGARELDMNTVLNTLSKAKHVPGRFHVFKKKGVKAIVDYAHTPDALEKVIQSARQLTKGSLITVFGCGGERDKGKRPLMGRIASLESDYTIVTSDNPRSEDPLAIIEDIKMGLNGKRWIVEPDRRKAIIIGLQMLTEGDTLIVAGKGHENYQILKDTAVPFSDIQVIEEYLKA